jgi:eukaryotic-like serine/threonine-protein kinase
VDDQLWVSVESHFDALRELPAQDRAARLGAIADDEVRREVGSLLEHAGKGNTVTSVVGAMAAQIDAIRPREERIGPWRLVRRLGAGGQGAVFEAIRDDGNFEQRVAIKVVKWEIDTAFSRDRFRHERQILATLEHPHIARLLDGGETSDGAPYIVMELVDGEPIDQYAAGLDPRSKLRLFLKVCDAVAYAHRNLIIHRDLKPANILVTKDGVPKLLDFGIAKLLDPEATATQTALMALTPDYASPEQVLGQVVATPSDVYSLGAVLYKLLSGRKPYAVDAATPLTMAKTICEAEPSAPGLGDELDLIVLTALRKEPERRYDSARQLAEDIERYLDHRPLAARGDTTFYRARKYVRRHWVSLAAATVALAGVCSGAVVALHEAQIARRQFNAVRQLANRFLFDFHDEIAKTPGNVRAREMIVSTALEYLGRLERDSSGDPDLQWELAVAYMKVAAAQGSTTRPSLRRPRDAVNSLEKALSLARPLTDRRSFTAEQRQQLVNMLSQASILYGHFREYDKAASLGREAVARSGTQEERGKAMANLAGILEQKGDLLGSAAVVEQVLSLRREAVKRDPSRQNRQSLASALTILGTARVSLTQLEQAGESVREALVIAQDLVAENPDSNVTRRRLMSVLELRGRIAGSPDQISFGNLREAAEHYQQGAAAMAPLLNDPNDRSSRNDAGLLLDAAAQCLCEVDPEKALPLARRAAELLDASGGEYRAEARIYSACAWRTLHRFSPAESQLKEAEHLLNDTQLEMRLEFALSWARLKTAEAKNDEAAVWFRRAITAAEDLYRQTSTPRAAFQLTKTLQSAAAALPGPVDSYRTRIVEVWTDQDRRYPGQPRIMQQLAEARQGGR